MDKLPIDNSKLFPKFDEVYSNFIATLTGKIKPEDVDIQEFMQAMIDAQAASTQSCGNVTLEDFDSADSDDDASEDEDDDADDSDGPEEDSEDNSEADDSADDTEGITCFYKATGVGKKQAQGYGIQLTFSPSHKPLTQCICEKWRNSANTDIPHSNSSTTKAPKARNVGPTTDVHVSRYLSLLHAYHWLHEKKSAALGGLSVEKLRRSITNLKVVGEEENVAAISGGPNVATRHRAKSLFRHIFISSHPLLSGHQPGALRNLLTCSEITAVCPALSLVATPLPKPCRCISQAYIGFFDKGERVHGISVFPDGSAIEKNETSDSFVYHHADGRTSVFVTEEGEEDLQGDKQPMNEDIDGHAEDNEEGDDEDQENSDEVVKDVESEDDDESDDASDDASVKGAPRDGDEDDENEDNEDELNPSVLIERDSAGAVMFAGSAVNGVKHGPGALAAGDGAVYIGSWCQGEFSCDDGAWVIPSGNCNLNTQLAVTRNNDTCDISAIATGEVRALSPDAYPIVLAYYHGSWRKGKAVNTRTLIFEHKAALTSPSLNPTLVVADDNTVKYDASTSTRISRTPMQPDAWEAVWVRVCNSKINLSPASSSTAVTEMAAENESAEGAAVPMMKTKGSKRAVTADGPTQAKKARIGDGEGMRAADGVANGDLLLSVDAGEGLVAARLIPKGTILAWYNGTRPSTKEVDTRPWQLNGNAMTLIEDKSVCIDIPAPYDQTSCYVASHGHKANHDFHKERVNAAYDFVTHPRFAEIKCVVATADIPAGSEISTDYGYSRARGGPDWFRAGVAARRKALLEQINAQLPAGKPRRTRLTAQETEELMGEPVATHHDHLIKDLRDCDVRLLPAHAAIAVMAAKLLEMRI